MNQGIESSLLGPKVVSVICVTFSTFQFCNDEIIGLVLRGSNDFPFYRASLILTTHLKITSVCCHLTYKLSNAVRSLREQLLPPGWFAFTKRVKYHCPGKNMGKGENRK